MARKLVWYVYQTRLFDAIDAIVPARSTHAKVTTSLTMTYSRIAIFFGGIPIENNDLVPLEEKFLSEGCLKTLNGNRSKRPFPITVKKHTNSTEIGSSQHSWKSLVYASLITLIDFLGFSLVKTYHLGSKLWQLSRKIIIGLRMLLFQPRNSCNNANTEPESPVKCHAPKSDPSLSLTFTLFARHQENTSVWKEPKNFYLKNLLTGKNEELQTSKIATLPRCMRPAMLYLGWWH